jgi:hypothetical protein
LTVVPPRDYRIITPVVMLHGNVDMTFIKEIDLKVLLLIIGMFLMETSSAQQGSTSLNELERRERLENAIRTLEETDVAVSKFAAVREMACKKAIGSDRFCSCLSGELPVAWTFENYVAITTKTKAENQYASLPIAYKKAYDAVGPIRDKCVAIFSDARAIPRK